MNKELLKLFNYIEYNESDIKEYEPDNINVNLEERKKIIINKIKIQNSISCDEYVLKNLNAEEFIVERFKGETTSVSFFANMNSFEYRYVPYMFRDIGQYYTIYLTNRRLVIIETNNMLKVKKDTFFDLEDIISFKYKKKSYGYKFVFRFIPTDKYDFREAYFMNGEYFKYYYRIMVKDKRVEQIIDKLNKSINIKNN